MLDVINRVYLCNVRFIICGIYCVILYFIVYKRIYDKNDSFNNKW